MDKEKMLEEIQEKTEEIKGRAEELHKVIEETIAQKNSSVKRRGIQSLEPGTAGIRRM